MDLVARFVLVTEQQRLTTSSCCDLARFGDESYAINLLNIEVKMPNSLKNFLTRKRILTSLECVHTLYIILVFDLFSFLK